LFSALTHRMQWRVPTCSCVLVWSGELPLAAGGCCWWH
jgi:hypothetical protein